MNYPPKPMWLCLCALFQLLLSPSLAIAQNDNTNIITNKEITDLYTKAEKQMVSYAKELEEIDRYFSQELIGKGYITKVFNTPVKDIHSKFKQHQQYVTEALQKHQANAKQMGRTSQWIDKMRGWADFNTKQAIKYTWQAHMELTKAKIARLYTQATRFSAQQAKNLRTQEQSIRNKHGSDYKKIDRDMAAIYNNIGNKEKAEVEKIWQQYKIIGNDFANTRKRLATDTWRWFHYHQDRNFDDRAREYKKLVYKSFAYNLDSRPTKLVNEFFGGRAFADSDMDFFMNMPGTEDRLTMYIHAAKDLDVFYKLNRFVADKPIELYDHASELAPLPVSGSMIERIAKLLSSRQKSYYRVTQEIDAQLVKLDRSLSDAEKFIADIKHSNNLVQDLNRFISETQSLESLTTDIETAEANLQDVENQLNKTHKTLISHRIDLQDRQKYQQTRIILDYRTNQYRIAKPGESAKTKAELLKSFNLRIKFLDEQLAIQSDPASDTAKSLLERKQQLITTRQRIAALTSEKDKALEKAIADLEQEETKNQRAYDTALKTLKDLQAKKNASNTDATNTAFTSLQQKYRQFYNKLTEKHLASLAKQALIKPNANDLGSDLIAQLETLLSYQRSLTAFQSTLREHANKAQSKVNSQLAILKRLDKRQAQYAKAVTRHKAQAASVIIYVAQQAGASNTDPIVQYMKALREAVNETNKYLTPSALFYEKMKLSDEEQTLLNTANSVVQYFASDTLKAIKFDKLQEKLDVANRATALVKNYASKGEVTGTTLSALRSSDAPNLSNSLSYFATITEIGKMVSDGAPVFGDLFGSYMDFMASSIKTIQSQALSIQDRVFTNAEKFLVTVKPENHLYTAREIKSELPTINFSDRDRVLRIYQIRRVIALMQASSFKEVCDRPLNNSNRCN